MRAHNELKTSLVFLLTATAAACGSVSASNTDAGGGGANGGDAAMEMAPLTNDQACDQMAQALCGRLNACAPPALPLYYVDMATCLARVKLGCTKDQDDADITRTATDIAACGQAAMAAGCDDLIANILPPACQTKPGTRLNGEGCGSSLQCMSAHCEVTSGDCGTCAPQSSVNGNCTSDDGCMAGLGCANGKCVTPGDLDAACNDNNPCRRNLYCSKTTNTCATRQPAGTHCGGDPNVCDVYHGAVCNQLAVQANQVCETISVAGGGSACGFAVKAPLCVLNNTCSNLLGNGICPNPAMDGQACDANVHCLPPANCVSGLCRFPSVAACTK